MPILQVIYIFIFALFGMATTDLARFIYLNWRYEEIRLNLIIRVTAYSILIVILAVLGPLLFA
ncbi:hypothetical protein [Pseudoalteromonas xiamenensis]|uniref:Uncharacterized protein n=1 Tax=Pseudoalteromonas xiamenensis TaxID=882626 RepID=A0A975DEU3_9GAMM|nr:hypothetical protein [Pseudoalteromonas xiamenensis]QTH70274.1 hypothetical protein J5O05_09545 [Pseudoalteromonas xiamenensis]WMN58544.1 hypothetical protein NI389_09745 [Pseudoalteromonas xiamenensis]